MQASFGRLLHFTYHAQTARGRRLPTGWERELRIMKDTPMRPASVTMITIGTMLATLMQALDMTISNVALPYMAGTFAASYDESTWVLTSYIVAAAIMTPPTGWLAAKFGRRRLFLTSVFGFTATSALCGLSGSLTGAVVSRSLQGLFGAALVPLSQATLLDNYPPERHAYAMAIFGIGIMLGPILGPTLGGWLTENWTWRWVYFINVPVGAVAALLIWRYVRETDRSDPPAFDIFGFLAISIAVACLQVVLDRGEIKDWFGSTQIIIIALIASISFYLFLVHTFTVRSPFISPDLFLNRNFLLGSMFIFIIGIVLFGTLALFPPFLQELLDFPVVTVGILLAPRGIGTMIAMLIVAQLATAVQPRLLMIFGFLVCAYAMWGMATFSLQIGPRDVFLWGVVQGFGVGFIFPPLTSTAFSTLPPARRTEAAGIYNLVRNIGSSVGISIMTALIDRNTQINHATIAGPLSPFNRTLHQPPYTAFFNVETPRGLSLLNEQVTKQAAMIGYIDDFKLMMLVTLLAAPFALMMKVSHINVRRENKY